MSGIPEKKSLGMAFAKRSAAFGNCLTKENFGECVAWIMRREGLKCT